jgi:MFS family permease
MGPALLPWVMTAYALAFAGFLLFGGRAADVLGHRRTLLGGVAVYAAGAAVAACAPAGGVLVAGRALQCVGAALSGPPALALVAAVFTDPRERARAMRVFVAISASSLAGALVVGGVLTSAAGWRTPFLALLAGFAVRERLAAEPLLPLGLLRLRTVRAATVSGVVFYTTMVGLLFFAPSRRWG